ncbi:MAG: ABC transporter permease subunit, partial [Gammaproteobacteria bacterium]|nr:ABC transporter permease subunit [Gammaproteobacteria bacterium]
MVKAWSLKAFLGLSLLLLCLPLIANQNPLFMLRRGTIFFPVFFHYSEQDLGGHSFIHADFKDELLQEESWILWPLIPYGPLTVDYSLHMSGPQKPSLTHWLGTDEQGRDVLARVLYALRFSFFFGLAVTLFSTAIGFFIGALQGYRGGWIDLLLQRIVEIWFSIPVLFLMMVMASLFSVNVITLFLALVFLKWRTLVPLIRPLFLRARTLPFVEAARMMGQGPWIIILRHILPTIIIYPLARLPFMMISIISILTTLEFFGFSLPSSMLS